MITAGLAGGFGHDSAAAVVRDGCVVAAIETERIVRRKEAPGVSPVVALQACLEEGGLQVHEVDRFALSWDPRLLPTSPELVAAARTVVDDLADLLGRRPDVTAVPHHLAHAAAGFYTSGFSRAAVLVLDDRGEQASTTMFVGRDGWLHEVESWPVQTSLGGLYAAVTRHIGFGGDAAGKTMGLAAFGRPSYDFPELVLDPEAGLRLDPGGDLRVGPPHAMADWRPVLARRFGPARSPRAAGVRTLDGIPAGHRDAAASVQGALERALAHLVRRAVAATGSDRVVLAGGVALNCRANGLVRSLPEVGDLHVLGCAGDSGGALGAAFVADPDGAAARWRRARPARSLAWGRSPRSVVAVERAGRLGLCVRRAAGDALADEVAGLLAAGRVGGWFTGRDEFGPRALGNRSVIARADDRRVAQRVNAIKGREPWRPLAPALLAREDAAPATTPWARHEPGLDFMVEARWPADTSGLEGVVHADGSTRPLLVTGVDHPFSALLHAVRRRAGTAAVLNTSFNAGGEPLVHDPLDALRTFVSSDLDFLALDDTLLVKPR